MTDRHSERASERLSMVPPCGGALLRAWKVRSPGPAAFEAGATIVACQFYETEWPYRGTVRAHGRPCMRKVKLNGALRAACVVLFSLLGLGATNPARSDGPAGQSQTADAARCTALGQLAG